MRINNGKKRELRALGYFFSILHRRVRYFDSDKFLDSGTVYRSFVFHLSGRTCTSGKNIVGKTLGNVRKESANAGFAKREKLQNTGNDVVSRIRLRWPFHEIRNCATYLRRRLSTPRHNRLALLIDPRGNERENRVFFLVISSSNPFLY